MPLTSRDLGKICKLGDEMTYTSIVQQTLKKVVRAPLGLVGLELHRRKRNILPPLFDSPFEAYYERCDGRSAAFNCPIDKMVDLKGFSYGPEGWHPFVAVLNTRAAKGEAAAEALLAQFYELHQPRMAAEAIIGFSVVPDLFHTASPELYYLTPWCPLAPEAVRVEVHAFTARGNAQHGRPDLNLEQHGFPAHGPVHFEKRRLELRRLGLVADALHARGYDRSHGDVNVELLRRGKEFRCYVQGGGLSPCCRGSGQRDDYNPHAVFHVSECD